MTIWKDKLTLRESSLPLKFVFSLVVSKKGFLIVSTFACLALQL